MWSWGMPIRANCAMSSPSSRGAIASAPCSFSTSDNQSLLNAVTQVTHEAAPRLVRRSNQARA